MSKPKIDIDKIIDEYYDSTIHKYVNQVGESRASMYASNRLLLKTNEGRKICKLGGYKTKLLGKGFHNKDMMKERDEKWSSFRIQQTESKITKEHILEAHSKFSTHTDILNYLNIWRGTYSRLCKKYNLDEVKYDKTKHNGSSSQETYVYRLIEIPREIYASRKKVKKELGITRLRTDTIDYTQKIKFETDKFGRKVRLRLTGKTYQVGNRTPSNEVQVFELVEEFVGVFPSRNEVYRQIGEVSIQSCLSGKIYQSRGYRFYNKKIH